MKLNHKNQQNMINLLDWVYALGDKTKPFSDARNYRQQISTYRSRLYSSILENGRSGKDYRCKCVIAFR